MEWTEQESQRSGAIHRHLNVVLLPPRSPTDASHNPKASEAQVLFTESLSFVIGSPSSPLLLSHTLPLESLAPYVFPNTTTYILSSPSLSSPTTLKPMSNLTTSNLSISSLSLSNSGRLTTPTLPVSPYPLPIGSTVRIPLPSPSLSSSFQAGDEENRGPNGSNEDEEGVRFEWIECRIEGYRDEIARPAFPGTYDPLLHIILDSSLPPSAVGAPILDAATGAVVGVVDSSASVGSARGSQAVRKEKGGMGRGIVAERVWEMFDLPGFRVKYG
ncbi:hypothetical protein BT69DRAFT_1302582 [Atractiella rhizophila]|nr:hypothetical protein BT69DRAFT_1302582 [Atractiella rhizophila]